MKTVALLEQEHTLFAQHMFVKMHLTGTERGSSKHQVLELINEYGGKVVDFGEEHLTAEITGTKEKVDSFVEKIRKFWDPGVTSSGDIAIGIGWDNTLSVAPRERRKISGTVSADEKGFNQILYIKKEKKLWLQCIMRETAIYHFWTERRSL